MSKLIKLNIAWNSIRWKQVSERVRRIQRRIYKARKNGQLGRVHWLQNHLIRSLDAKYLAVRTVTTVNRGKNTAGVDKVKGLSGSQKVALAKKLRLNGKALPIRRVWIPKPGKAEKRPLGIPTIHDRAKQALAKLALEPEWEAVFESNSYGFRPGRCSHDAIEAIFLAMRHKTPKWVYDADIRKCFDRIDHKALLDKLGTFPEMEKQVEAWLKANIMEGYADNPKDVQTSTMGTPQGGVISPLLANIALHGLENHLKKYVGDLPMRPRPTANRGRVAKEKALTIVRYADDFVLIHENREILDLCIQQTSEWLKNIGLEVSEEKTTVRDGRQGFKFLGFQVIQVRSGKEYKAKITPSTEKQTQLLEKIRKVIQLNKSSSAYKLVRTLRPIIIGWANYYRYCECQAVFRKLTHSIFSKVRAWVFRRDTRNGRKVVKEKYFPVGKTYTFNGTKHNDNWILYGKQKGAGNVVKEAFLPHMVWISSKKFVKVKEDKSPHDGDYMYWSVRAPKYTNASTRVQTLLKRQEMKCSLCKQKFTVFDQYEVDHVIPLHRGGQDQYNNLQLLHKHCHVKKTAQDLLSMEAPLQEPDEAKVSRPDLKTR